MEQLAQDWSLVLEESKSGVGKNLKNRRWGMKRRTRSAGNLYLRLREYRSDDSTSSNSEIKHFGGGGGGKHPNSLHQSDSDDMCAGSGSMSRALADLQLMSLQEQRSGKARSYTFESDSFNENSPSRPSLRRKRKLKRINLGEAPIAACGKRKHPQRLDPTCVETMLSLRGGLEGLRHSYDSVGTSMEAQCADEACEVGSESSLSLSGGEGHDGDDELTDWAPPTDQPTANDPLQADADPREIRAGCRRLQTDQRPGFSISTGANEKVARFLRDAQRTELHLYGAGPERTQLAQLAALYSLELCSEGQVSLLRKTSLTPCMQPAQRHHISIHAGHKKICTRQGKR